MILSCPCNWLLLSAHVVLVVVEILLWDSAPHELRLTATDIDVLEQYLAGRLGSYHLLGLCDLGVNIGAGLLIDRLKLLLGGDTPVKEFLLEAGDGVVGAAHTLNLFTCLKQTVSIFSGLPDVVNLRGMWFRGRTWSVLHNGM